MGIFFDPSPYRTQVWSDGGGTQSCYIATLICRGVLPKPDLCVMVNTGREIDETFDYHHRYVIPSLERAGVKLHIIEKTQYASCDLTSKNGKSILIPAFTNQSGEVGKLPTYCSGEWKRDAISRWLREQGVEQCDMWMGYSLDEMRRVKGDRRKWLRKIYPLIDMQKNRNQCIAGVLDFGWPLPPRSRCWMCPQQCHREWKDLHDRLPDEFEKACVFEETEITPRDPNMFLHESCIPLRQVDFGISSPSGFESGCDSGLCFV